MTFQQYCDHLDARLEGYTVFQRIAVAAACLERLRSVYVEYAHRTGMCDIDIYDRAVGAIWRYVATRNEENNDELCGKLAQQTPDHDAAATQGYFGVTAVGSALIEALSTTQSGPTPDSISRVLLTPFDIISNALEAAAVERHIEPETLADQWLDPLMQSEVQRLERDLKLVEDGPSSLTMEDERRRRLATRAADFGVPVLCSNQ